MKKIIFVFLLLLMSVSVFGQGGESHKLFDDKDVGKVGVTNKPVGLEKAIVVANENATAKLVRNLERFQERHQIRNCKEECKIDLEEQNGTSVIEVQREQKFLRIFKFTAREKFTVNNEGEIISQQDNFWEKFRKFRLQNAKT